MKTLHKLCAGFFAVALLFVSGLFPLRFAYAAEAEVLTDLRKDSTFKASDYPSVASDHSLKVIQIAEGAGQELYLYVYQPCDAALDLRATSVNFATEPVKTGGTPRNYKLQLVSTQGVFDKYLVEGFRLRDGLVRCYEIISIYRAWDKRIDDPPQGGETVNEVPYAVAKRYTAATVDGKTVYDCVDTDVIEVTEKHCGYIRYNNGFALLNTACFSHYVAFNTDLPIDRLYEADVSFVSQAYSYSSFSTGNPWVPGMENTQYEEAQQEAVTLHGSDVGHYEPGGWLWWSQYTWDRIVSAEEFIAAEPSLTSEAREMLEGFQWVLRFKETEFSANATASTYNETGTYISEVTILRLMFETKGRIYNLGVVDNKQTEPAGPDNDPWTALPNDLLDTGKILLAILALILLIVILAPFLPYVVQGLIWLITLPFRAISKLIKSKEDKQPEKKEKK